MNLPDYRSRNSMQEDIYVLTLENGIRDIGTNHSRTCKKCGCQLRRSKPLPPKGKPDLCSPCQSPVKWDNAMKEGQAQYSKMLAEQKAKNERDKRYQKKKSEINNAEISRHCIEATI